MSGGTSTLHDGASPVQTEMKSYYSARASHYDAVYEKPERKNDIEFLSRFLPERLTGRNVIEVACGTGFWSQFIAPVCKHYVATDGVAEPMSCRANLDTEAGMDSQQDRHSASFRSATTLTRRKPSMASSVFRRLAALTFVTLTMSACSTQAWYEGLKFGAEDECRRQPPGEVERCLSRLNKKAYGEYEKERFGQ